MSQNITDKFAPNKINRSTASIWFEALRDMICCEFEKIELDYDGAGAGKFTQKAWNREGGGGGVMSKMNSKVFEKVGVNISTVHGVFSEEFRGKIPGTLENPNFFATGISVVAHMRSPLVPAIHFNTRYIETKEAWFGGGSDLTPMFIDEAEAKIFHDALQKCCNQHHVNYYDKFKAQCDEYFYLKHRAEARGIGGIFFDYLNEGDFDKNFVFVKDVGLSFLSIYSQIVRAKMFLKWSQEQREHQLIKRGRYVEFNLLYDRGTTFGLMTKGNVEAILMSMPPEVKWL